VKERAGLRYRIAAAMQWVRVGIRAIDRNGARGWAMEVWWRRGLQQTGTAAAIATSAGIRESRKLAEFRDLLLPNLLRGEARVGCDILSKTQPNRGLEVSAG